MAHGNPQQAERIVAFYKLVLLALACLLLAGCDSTVTPDWMTHVAQNTRLDSPPGQRANCQLSGGAHGC